MMKKLLIFIRRYYPYLLDILCVLICIGILSFISGCFTKNRQVSHTAADPNYVIFAANDLGMHCYEDTFESFMILPLGNTLKVQVFLNEGENAALVNSGIDVYYQFIDNTTSAGKTNFWEYAADYGFNIAPDVGITGNGLSGKMVLSEDKKYYTATMIPITPYSDGSNELEPFQLATITIKDNRTGEVLASTENVVTPVSDEMNCNACHGPIDTDKNILRSHDKLSGTTLSAELENGKRYKCSDCHKDNALQAPGKEGVLPLSQAMHGFHADKVYLHEEHPECYNCHPGPVSQCYRSVMLANGVSCVNPNCHGDMANIAKTQASGREAWLQEPVCTNCHSSKYAVNPGTLYRHSYLMNNSNSKMNGFILCISCHNSPHAEWTSVKPVDNLLPTSLQGFPGYISKCSVCHESTGTIHDIVIAK